MLFDSFVLFVVPWTPDMNVGEEQGSGREGNHAAHTHFRAECLIKKRMHLAARIIL